MNLREFNKITAFILIFVGTAGLLLNEFVWVYVSVRTLIFGAMNFIGLVGLAFAHVGMKKSRAD